MVKPIFVPAASSSAAAGAAVNEPRQIIEPSPTQHQQTLHHKRQKTQQQQQQSVSSEETKTIGPNINFTEVFNELQKYKQGNNNSLIIPTSHPTLSRIIDSLSTSYEGIESLSKKRWEDQFMALKKFKDEYGDVDVPLTHVSTYCVGNFSLFLSLDLVYTYYAQILYKLISNIYCVTLYSLSLFFFDSPRWVAGW